jgi:hypothetical protein
MARRRSKRVWGGEGKEKVSNFCMLIKWNTFYVGENCFNYERNEQPLT